MGIRRLLCLVVVVVVMAVVLAPIPVGLNAQQSVAVRTDNDDIGGVVTIANFWPYATTILDFTRRAMS